MNSWSRLKINAWGGTERQVGGCSSSSEHNPTIRLLSGNYTILFNILCKINKLIKETQSTQNIYIDNIWMWIIICFILMRKFTQIITRKHWSYKAYALQGFQLQWQEYLVYPHLLMKAERITLYFLEWLPVNPENDKKY